jgi:hypothetical protein
MHITQWRFEQLAKQFEVLECDLTDCQDAEQRKENLLLMQAILNEIDELLREPPALKSTRNRTLLPRI